MVKKLRKLDFNPWLTIFNRPRETIRKILRFNTNYHVLLLAMLGGIASAIDKAAANTLGNYMSITAILIFTIIAGAIGGLLSLYVFSGLLKLTGDWIGGKASYGGIRTVFSWSMVPLVWGMILWIPQLLIFGQEVFSSSTVIFDSSRVFILLAALFFIIDFVLWAWNVIILVIGLSEVQKFSIWKAIANILLSALLLIVAMIIIIIILIMVGAPIFIGKLLFFS
jgi:hypothetical protein